MKSKLNNIASTILGLVSVLLFILAHLQIDAQNELLEAYSTLEDSQNNGYVAQAERIKAELPELKSKVNGELKALITFGILSLVGMVALRYRNREDT